MGMRVEDAKDLTISNHICPNAFENCNGVGGVA